jgi:hypothetical protein
VIKYEVNVGDNIIFISLNTSSPNERAVLIYEGDSSGIGNFKTFLENTYGAFGHTIGETTTAIDLHYTMSNQQQFQAKIVEGQDLITKYDPEIPDGAVT